jgi:Flp pilus assembly pilin Flp
MAVTELPMRAAVVVQRAHDAVLERAYAEQGVSTVQYALVVAVVALLVAVLVGVLGAGAKGLFGSAHAQAHAHACAHVLNRTSACGVAPVVSGSAAATTP